MEAMLRACDVIDDVLAKIARLGGWLFLALVVVICWDILTRKIGFQLPGFGSTPVQELEWHLHGALFLSWLGYAYVRNVHVRIDVFTNAMSPRRKAWLEVFGIVAFAIPYCIVSTWFAFGFAELSLIQGESSSAPNGLGMRWIIKGCLFLGLVLLCMAVFTVLMRHLIFLFGPPEIAARARAFAASH